MRIAVAGATKGKTSIATSLALALFSSSRSNDALPTHIAFADCNVTSPHAANLLHPRLGNMSPVEMMIPLIDAEACTLCGRCVKVCNFHALALVRDQILFFDDLCLGCDNCRLSCPDQAITRGSRRIGFVENGRMGSMTFVHGLLDPGQTLPETIIHEIKRRLISRRNQAVIIAAPDGTSSSLFEALSGCNYVLLVAGSTRFDLHNLRRVVSIARETLGIPVGTVLWDSQQEKGVVQAYCEQENIPILMRVPQNRRVTEAHDQGIPLIMALPAFEEPFLALYRRIAEKVGS